MRVLMINSVCGIRSTGRICYDLSNALITNGHEVRIAYGREKPSEQSRSISKRIGSKADVGFHAVKARLADADGLGSYYPTKTFIEWVDEYNPDVIHLHNLHGYYLNVPSLFKYISKKNIKVIWTLHDMWPFTGHSATCSYYNCEKWKSGCYSCPAQNHYPSSIIDRSYRNYQWKKKIFNDIKSMTIVTPSNWLASLVKQSFLKDYPTIVIPNGIDTGVFHATDSDFKATHNLDNKIIIMGCATWWSKSKGLLDFYALSEKLDKKYKIVLVGLSSKQMKELPSEIIGIERTNCVEELVKIYNAADIFLNLTYCDNYPTVNLEALACGTPVITYDTGGSSECIDHTNGKVFQQGDLQGIIEFLNNEYSRNTFIVGKDSCKDKSDTLASYLSILS